MKKATIYDYLRLCQEHRSHTGNCEDCPLDGHKIGASCIYLMRNEPDKANEIILKWCEEHPAETRQSKIQKIIPAITLDVGEEYVDICPKDIDTDFISNKLCDNYAECSDCKREYWLAEVDENNN